MHRAMVRSLKIAGAAAFCLALSIGAAEAKKGHHRGHHSSHHAAKSFRSHSGSRGHHLIHVSKCADLTGQQLKGCLANASSS